MFCARSRYNSPFAVVAHLATVPREAKLLEAVVQQVVLTRAAGVAEKATMFDTSAACALIQKARNEGLAGGRHEGLAAGLRPLVRQFERRLGRPLSDAERGALAARLDVVGPERPGDVVLDLDSPALAVWLASPTAT